MSKYEIKEKIDEYIYKSYNLLSNTLFNFSKDKEVVKTNIKFKDIHLGKRCFILGTGPSLKNFDYKLLEDEIVFGVNYVYKGEIINHIVPKYYCIYDENFYYRDIQDLKDVMEKLKSTTFFLRTKAIDPINKLKPRNSNIYYQSCNVFQYNDYIKVDMTKNITAPFNVVLGCIQTAIYMGFKEIYLLGCDYNSFASQKLEHFYDDNSIHSREMTLGFELKYYAMVTYHHYALNKYANDNGLCIYNITPNSLLDAYKRVDIYDIFK